MSAPQKMNKLQKTAREKARRLESLPQSPAEKVSDAALRGKIPPIPPSQTPAKKLSKALQRSGLMEEFFFPPEPPHPPHFPEEEEP